MKRFASAMLIGVFGLALSGTSLLAHDETYMGTVVTVAPAKIQVKVVDQKSKKDTTMDFGINAKTKIMRGDKTLPFAEARIRKDERIAVTVNREVSGDNAMMLHLAAPK